jgi:hypothetical protein
MSGFYFYGGFATGRSPEDFGVELAVHGFAMDRQFDRGGFGACKFSMDKFNTGN